jgi:hypothetical protein
MGNQFPVDGFNTIHKLMMFMDPGGQTELLSRIFPGSRIAALKRLDTTSNPQLAWFWPLLTISHFSTNPLIWVSCEPYLLCFLSIRVLPN